MAKTVSSASSPGATGATTTTRSRPGSTAASSAASNASERRRASASWASEPVRAARSRSLISTVTTAPGCQTFPNAAQHCCVVHPPLTWRRGIDDGQIGGDRPSGAARSVHHRQGCLPVEHEAGRGLDQVGVGDHRRASSRRDQRFPEGSGLGTVEEVVVVAAQLAGGRDDHLPRPGVDGTGLHRAGAERPVAAGAEIGVEARVGPVARAQGQVAVGRVGASGGALHAHRCRGAPLHQTEQRGWPHVGHQLPGQPRVGDHQDPFGTGDGRRGTGAAGTGRGQAAEAEHDRQRRKHHRDGTPHVRRRTWW